jgi:hypothetical protein
MDIDIYLFIFNLDLSVPPRAIGQSVHPVLPEIYTPPAAPKFLANWLELRRVL